MLACRQRNVKRRLPQLAVFSESRQCNMCVGFALSAKLQELPLGVSLLPPEK
jgi:hypothetical protein